jgi:hypothetical protein
VALSKLHGLRKAEQPQFTPNLDPWALVAEFLSSARGVYPTAKTYCDGLQPPAPGRFTRWRDTWEGQLSRADLDLWRRMEDERHRHEHGDGAALITVDIPVPMEFTHPNPIVLGLSAAEANPPSYKNGVRFKGYPERPASEVCEQYLALCRRFVEDLLRSFPP